MCIHKMSYRQFNNLDFGLAKYVDWDKVYAVVTCVIIDIIDACISCDIKSNFDGS